MSFLLASKPKIIITNLVGSLPFWTFTVNSLYSAAESLKTNASMLTRVLLPKTFFPVSEVLRNCYTLTYSFTAMYCSLLLFFPEMFKWKIVFIPILALPLIMSVLVGGVVAAYATPYIHDIPQCLRSIWITFILDFAHCLPV